MNFYIMKLNHFDGFGFCCFVHFLLGSGIYICIIWHIYEVSLSPTDSSLFAVCASMHMCVCAQASVLLPANGGWY